jgi:hypothetical protein
MNLKHRYAMAVERLQVTDTQQRGILKMMKHQGLPLKVTSKGMVTTTSELLVFECAN